MGGKRIEEFDVYEVPSRGPHSKLELIFETADGWLYTYNSFSNEEPFTFHHKRRPDMTISEDDVTPRSIKEFVDSHPNLELVNAKTIYHTEYPARRLDA